VVAFVVDCLSVEAAPSLCGRLSVGHSVVRVAARVRARADPLVSCCRPQWCAHLLLLCLPYVVSLRVWWVLCVRRYGARAHPLPPLWFQCRHLVAGHCRVGARRLRAPPHCWRADTRCSSDVVSRILRRPRRVPRHRPTPCVFFPAVCCFPCSHRPTRHVP